MKNLFEPATRTEVQTRLAHLQPNSPPQWGSMNVAQAVAHCAMGLEISSGTLRPPRKLIGRILGPIIKPKVLGDDEPLRRNSPTMIAVANQRNFEAERHHLRELIDQFAATGPAGCTTHPHSFFGKLTPDEWAILMYKHLDHHLRQFGA
jgi:hypothetical protein